MPDQKVQTISWISPEYIQKERTVDWFWTIGLISIIGAGLALYFNNNLFAILILISCGMFFLLSIHTPRDVEYQLSEEGLSAGEKKYSKNDLLSFDIKKEKEDIKLLIHTSGKFMPIITIQIPEDMKEEIQFELSKFSEKKEFEDSIAMKFMDMLGF